LTPQLFHGPGARDRAVDLSEEVGRPVCEPMGDKGLKVADARAIVEIAVNPGVGSRPPSLVLGPIDQATPEAADALLKTLEDLTEAPLRIFLWADFLGQVSPTIRSRSRATWCPPGPRYQDPLWAMEQEALDLCTAVVKQDPVRVLGLVADAGKDWPDLLEALTHQLCKELDGVNGVAVVNAWLRLRPALDGKGSALTAYDALLPEEL